MKKIIFENQRYYSFFSRERSIFKIILENCCNQNNLNGTLSEKKTGIAIERNLQKKKEE